MRFDLDRLHSIWIMMHYGLEALPKGQSESVYRRRTDNTMDKAKKVHKDKQRSTKHKHKTKDRVTRNPLKPGVNSGVPEG